MDATARHDDPGTSQAVANWLNRSGKAVVLGRQVLSSLAQGPKTTKETAAQWGVPRDSHSPRIKKLRDELGLVEDSGEVRDGATVWRLTESGQQFAENL